MSVIGGIHSYRHADERTGVAASDFISFYAAGKLANSAHPAAVYDPAQHLATERQIGGDKFPYLEFYYPPIFLLICAPLARLPYWVALLVFEASTLALYIVVMLRIVGPGFWPGVAPILAFPALFWNASFGQNAFLSAALFGVATLLVDRRPVTSGFCFGALAFKPHFGLLVPVALLSGRRWRSAAAAAACVALLVGLSAALFGIDTWHAFIATFLGAPSVYAHGHVKLGYLITVFGAAHVLGLPDRAAIAVQAIATVLAASVVFRAWRADLDLPARSAALLASTLTAVPIIMYYDLVLASVALGWLLRGGRQRGFTSGEKIAVGVVYLATLLTHFPGRVPPGSIGLAATTFLLVWVSAQVRRERASSLNFGIWAGQFARLNLLATVCRFDGGDDEQPRRLATASGRMPESSRH